MDDLSFELVNGPLTLLNIIGNLFFVYCLTCPPQEQETLKQPLKILLESLVCCTTIFLFSLIVDECVWILSSMYIEYIDEFLSFTVLTSMSTSVWLNFFYYTQIVPAQQIIFIYIKRNIKTIIYWSLFVDRVFFLFDLSVSETFDYFNNVLENATNNFTSTNDTVSGLYYTYLMCSYTKMFYLFFCLCVMVGSSWATVCYLHGHIKNMKDSSRSFSTPNLSNQMRVAISGIMQGIIFLLCALWIFANSIIDQFFNSNFITYNVYYTIVSFCMLGTTVILGIGQSVFRQKAADICLKVQQTIQSFAFDFNCNFFVD